MKFLLEGKEYQSSRRFRESALFQWISLFLNFVPSSLSIAGDGTVMMRRRCEFTRSKKHGAHREKLSSDSQEPRWRRRDVRNWPSLFNLTRLFSPSISEYKNIKSDKFAFGILHFIAVTKINTLTGPSQRPHEFMMQYVKHIRVHDSICETISCAVWKRLMSRKLISFDRVLFLSQSDLAITVEK